MSIILHSFKRTMNLLFFCGLVTTPIIAQNLKKQGSPSTLPPVVLGVSEDVVSASNIDSYIQDMIALGNLDAPDANYVITAQHISSTSGVHHIYYRQAVNGFEIEGTESSLHIASHGEIIKSDNRFIKAVTQKVNTNNASLTAKGAIQSVAQQMDYSISSLSVLESFDVVSKKAIYNSGGISAREIPVKEIYFTNNGEDISLVWELSVQERNTSDWWNFRVDAVTGTILYKNNFTVACVTGCSHSHEKEAILDECEVTEEATQLGAIFPENEPAALVGTYNVYPIPVESPYFGNRSVVTDPDDATASPFGWHDTNGVAGAEFTDTRGNNVDAHDDIANNNSPGSRASGGGGLNFNFAFDATQANPTGGLDPMPSFSTSTRSLDAALTNTFYWSNIIHDVMYQYGFDEASGNFQENNYGNGGAGSDSVDADVQDGSGTCNANFGTPGDGGNPTMQMFVCGTSDGDYDNLVIVHEYGHGISNRLTGGPGTGSCLNNDEQMGEGWSDFYGVMLTMDASNYTASRTVGTYLFEQGPSGAGIRNFPYSYDMTVNPQTYDDIKTVSGPHPLGSIWATILYDLAQELMVDEGFDPDLYNGTGGNNIALNLVTEGMKLQGCSPGFVSGRDGILAADQAIYGGAYTCTIWEVFARRGVGFSADEASTNSRTDGTEAFDLPPGTGGFTSTSTDICITSGVQTGLGGGTPTGGTYSGTGVTDDGNGTTFTFDPSVGGVGTVTVNYNVADACAGGGGTSDYTDALTVTSGNPALTCQNATVTLDGAGNATVTWPEVVSNFIPGGYTYTPGITYAPDALTGGATSVALGDDTGTAAIPIGFDFDFYSTTYSNFYIASNGFVSFTGNGMTGAASYTPTAIPNGAIPNGMIAGVWDDLSPNVGGTVQYELFGTAPNRRMVVEFSAVPLYNATETVTFQIKMFEGTNIVEVHFVDVQNNNGNRTFGLENAAGDEAITDPLTNLGNWTGATEASSFTPEAPSMAENCGNNVTVSLSQSDFTCQDVGANTITVTADDGNGGISTCTTTVTVVGETTTYTGGAWDNGTPDAGKAAVFNQNYNTSAGNITACSCEIGGAATVTVGADEFIDIKGNLTVNGTLTIEHQGTVRQDDDNATALNNGTINVELSTPALDERDFMIMGSPMTAETRGGVYTNAHIVLNLNPANFLPHPDVPAGGTNWADDNGDYYTGHTGVVTPGEGYVVRPQVGYTAPDNTVYDMTYTQGTLNNGVITYTATNNGATDNPSGTPQVVGNPYASAISANAFMATNTGVTALYFWEHLTPPGNGLPVSNLRFDMDDISIYNGTMGIPAANDPGTATASNGVISSGQGFGVRTTGVAGSTEDITFNNSMRLTSGNTTLRRPLEVEKLILEVRDTQHQVGSYTGLAFSSVGTQGYDQGMDTNRLATVVSMYSHLEDGSEQLGIQTREAFDADIKIPMGFSSQVGEYLTFEVSIASIEGVNLEQATVYLVDHQLGTITNLSETNYSFSSNDQDYESRFTLQFENELLGTNDAALQGIALFPNPTSEVLNIVSSQTQISQVAIYDVRGRKLSEQAVNNTSVQLDMQDLESAIYFVTITTEKGSISKRVIKL